MTTRAILNIEQENPIPLPVGMDSVSGFRRADFADFILVDTKQTGGNREALFQYVGGDEESPMTVRIGHYASEKGEDSMTNISVKIQTFVKKTDDDGVITLLPCSATLATSMPCYSGIPDEEDYYILLSNLLNWMLPAPSVSGSGEFDLSQINKLKFGVVSDLPEQADS